MNNTISIALTWLATALSLLVVDLIVPGVSLNTFSAALIAAVAVGLVNSFVKPIISILSLPLNILSLGLFSLVVNGICFWLAASFVPGFAVNGILAFIFGPIILSAVNAFLGNYLTQRTIDLNLAGNSTKAIGE
ncbi:MAG: phage holin family protein [Geitlerinemataceae cyanobacterium]